MIFHSISCKDKDKEMIGVRGCKTVTFSAVFCLQISFDKDTLFTSLFKEETDRHLFSSEMAEKP